MKQSKSQAAGTVSHGISMQEPERNTNPCGSCTPSHTTQPRQLRGWFVDMSCMLERKSHQLFPHIHTNTHSPQCHHTCFIPLRESPVITYSKCSLIGCQATLLSAQGKGCQTVICQYKVFTYLCKGIMELHVIDKDNYDWLDKKHVISPHHIPKDDVQYSTQHCNHNVSRDIL